MNMKQLFGTETNHSLPFHFLSSSDEEKRKMYRSISVKSSHHNQPNTSLNTDEEQIHDLMMTILDKIDKELNPSTSTDTCMIFNASSALQHHVSKNSSDNNHFDDDTFLPIPTNDHFVDDSFQSLDDYKHSIGILLDNNDDDNQNRYKNFNRVPSRKLFNKLFFLINIFEINDIKKCLMSSIGQDSDMLLK